MDTFVQQKIAGWVRNVEQLSAIAIIQPQAAYVALTHGLIHKWTYLAKTVPNIEELLKPLEDVYNTIFKKNFIEARLE